MPTPAPSPRRPRRRLLSSALQTAAILAGCLSVAAATTIPFERFLQDPRPTSADSSPPRTRLVTEVRMARGMSAPDFCLKSLSDGHPIRLSDYRGLTPVILVFGSFG